MPISLVSASREGYLPKLEYRQIPKLLVTSSGSLYFCRKGERFPLCMTAPSSSVVTLKMCTIFKTDNKYTQLCVLSDTHSLCYFLIYLFELSLLKIISYTKNKSQWKRFFNYETIRVHLFVLTRHLYAFFFLLLYYYTLLEVYVYVIARYKHGHPLYT